MSKGKDNSDEYSLFNDANIKNSLNNNFQNEKHISFGDKGVPETYVPNAKDKKSKEKKNSSNEKIPQNFKKGKIIIINNEIHINNSNNNNIKPSNNNEINSGNIEKNTKKVKIPNPLYIPKNINKINNININLKNNQIFFICFFISFPIFWWPYCFMFLKYFFSFFKPHYLMIIIILSWDFITFNAII